MKSPPHRIELRSQSNLYVPDFSEYRTRSYIWKIAFFEAPTFSKYMTMVSYSENLILFRMYYNHFLMVLDTWQKLTPAWIMPAYKPYFRLQKPKNSRFRYFCGISKHYWPRCRAVLSQKTAESLWKYGPIFGKLWYKLCIFTPNIRPNRKFGTSPV